MNSSFQSTSYNHSLQTNIIGTSGLKIFEGQDLTQGDRKRLQQLQSNAWYKQQMLQKQRRLQQQKNVKNQHDLNTLQTNQYRCQLQQQKSKRLREMQIAYRNFNQQQLEEKVNKQLYQKRLDQQQRQNHVQYITGHDFYTQNTETCQSQLNRNRVKPYHWKGMSDEQKREILEQQQKQRREKEMQSQLEKEEDKLFAQQMEAQRKAIVLQDRAKNHGLKNVRKGVDQYNKYKAEQMKRKAYYAYDQVQTYKNEA